MWFDLYFLTIEGGNWILLLSKFLFHASKVRA